VLGALANQHKGSPAAVCIADRIALLRKQQAKAPNSPSKCRFVEALVGNEQRCLKPGDLFRDCADCPEMAVVPAGEFTMGSPANEAERSNSEGPQRKVTIAKPFAVGKFEVTFAEWDACASASGCRHRPDDRSWGRDNRPVINVSWDDITKEYLPWLSRKTSKSYRLLTEAEWEYAARAGNRGKYAWGDEIGNNRANCNGCGSQWDNKQTAPVGSFQANAFSLHDMHGNVFEWVADCAKDSYVNAPSDGKAASDVVGCSRVGRGGSWSNDPKYLRSANRGWNISGSRSGNVGFRLARTLNP
jgi:formylglycine-generating enzyme required for sulfatase activity